MTQPPAPATEAPATEAGRLTLATAKDMAMPETVEGAGPHVDLSLAFVSDAILAIEREAQAAQQEPLTRITALRDELAKDDGVFTSDYFARRLSALLAPPAPARNTDPGDTEP